jgi:pimeloyl-ACP methyl ester carboxylesterase
LRCRINNVGYPVVLIHGMWCTGRSWDRVAGLLRARGYDCHAPNLPAHEPVPDQPLHVGARSLKEYLAFLEDYIARQNFSQPPVLIGHSMGGWLAQALAARLPVLATVLLTPAAPAGINGIRWRTLLAFLPHFLRWGFWRKPFKPTMPAARRYAFNGIPAAEQERLYGGMVHESGRAPFELGFWWLDAGGTARVDTAKVKGPVYVVGCGGDGLTPLPVVRKVAALYPQAALRVYDRRSHWVIDDAETENMVHEIAGWLQPLVRREQRQKAA